MFLNVGGYAYFFVYIKGIKVMVVVVPCLFIQILLLGIFA